MSLLKRIGQDTSKASQPATSPLKPLLPTSQTNQAESPAAAPSTPTGTFASRTGALETAPVAPGSPTEPVRRAVPPAQVDRATQMLNDLKNRVQNRLVAELDPKMDLSNSAAVRRTIQELFDSILEEEQSNITLTRVERLRLFEQIAAEIVGLGPLESLLKDDTITEIMVNGPNQVMIEQKGKITRVDVSFQNEDHLSRIIDRIVSQVGRRVDESSPICDARLLDGSRVHVVVPPISLVGPVLTIRKFRKQRFKVEDLIAFGSLSSEAAEFLKACVLGVLNIIVSGGTGSGKTTLLNVLADFIPDGDRIITVEDSAELQLPKEHWVRLETRKANVEGKGEVAIRDLVVACLRMRPDRIVVGECRRGEALDMLQAMNTGHDGSLTTLHANSPREAIARLETMVMMSGMDLPIRAIREQIAGAVDVIIQQSRLQDGSRKVLAITEVQGMEGDVVVLQDIFVFEQTSIENGKIVGRLRPTGLRPKFVTKMEEHGVFLPASVFGYNPRGF